MAGSVKSGRSLDVYELAADIGAELETIIDKCGAPALAQLVPKVIHVLEQLERLAARCEEERQARREQRRLIDRLQAEKTERADDKHRFEKELEEFEERTRDEIDRLTVTVAEVQCENTRLKQMCDQQQQQQHPHHHHQQQEQFAGSSVTCSADVPGGSCAVGSYEADQKTIQALKTLLDRQKKELCDKDAICRENTKLLDEARAELEQCRCTAVDLRRRHRQQLQLCRQLVDKRTAVELQLAEQRHLAAAARQQLDATQKDNHDLATSMDESLQNKLVYDRDDPDRPRFTVTELRDVLAERNQLKSRCSDLLDELSLYRPTGSDSLRSSSWVYGADELDSFSSSELSSPPSLQSELDQCRLNDSDRPVQGPLPAEPDDAPWKRQESGIKMLFRQLFGVSPSALSTSSSAKSSLRAARRSDSALVVPSRLRSLRTTTFTTATATAAGTHSLCPGHRHVSPAREALSLNCT